MEITLESVSFDGLSPATIVDFLRSHANVQQLNLIDCREDQKVELQEQLRNQWNIRIDGDDVYFQRKTNNQI